MNRHSLLLSILLCASYACAAELPTSQHAEEEAAITPWRELYVDGAGGRDSNPGTREQPLRTLRQAIATTIDHGRAAYIRVAMGSYGVTDGHLSASYDVQPIIVGGYAPGFAARDTKAYPTMLVRADAGDQHLTIRNVKLEGFYFAENARLTIHSAVSKSFFAGNVTLDGTLAPHFHNNVVLGNLRQETNSCCRVTSTEAIHFNTVKGSFNGRSNAIVATTNLVGQPANVVYADFARNDFHLTDNTDCAITRSEIVGLYALQDADFATRTLPYSLGAYEQDGNCY